MLGAKGFSLGALVLSVSVAEARPKSDQTTASLLSDSIAGGSFVVPAVKLDSNEDLEKRLISHVDVGAQWYIPVWIGTPGEKFYLLADSGAPSLLVESTLEPKELQGPIPLYDPSKSSTSSPLDGYEYHECYPGYCSNGLVYKDIVTIGQLALRDMPFLIMTNNSRPTQGGIRSGNLGLNLDDGGMQSTPTRVPTYFQQILPYLDEQLWTVDWQAKTQSGRFQFGAIDHSRYNGEIAYGSVIDHSGLYVAETQGIGAGYDDSAFRPHKFNIVWDTGTGGGTITREIAELYWSQVPNAEFRPDWDNYLYPCDQQLPDFVIKMSDGKKVGIPGDALLWKRADGKDEGKCVTMLALGGDNDTLWGQSWIEKFFVIFDWGNRRVGVASKNQ